MRKLLANFEAFVKKYKKFSIVLAIVVLVFGYVGIKQFTKTEAPVYQTEKAKLSTLISTVTASGQIVSTNAVTVTTGASGVIKEVFVTDGTTVNAGDKIMEITLDLQSQQKASAAWSSYLSAQNTLNTAQANINSLQSKLFKAHQAFVNGKGTADPDTDDPTYIQQRADWLQAEADYKNQQAVIGQAQAAVTSSWQSYQAVSSVVTAPVGGVVNDFIYTKGMSIVAVTTAQKVATIKNSGKPVAQFNLSELDVGKVQAGQKAALEIDAFPSKSFVGEVIGIDTSGVISSGVTNYPATVTFDGGKDQIFSNMAANATIVIAEKKDVLVVPSAAIQEQDNKTFVRVKKNGRIQQIPVVTGLTSDTETEIIEGLSVGEEVVIGARQTTSGTAPSRSPFSTQPRGFGAGGR